MAAEHARSLPYRHELAVFVFEGVKMNKGKAYNDLLKRITDIYSGAQGQRWDIDDFATAEQLSKVIPVLHEIFGTDPKKEWVFGVRAIDRFNDPASAADWIYEQIINV
jgi:hypothetical protein